MSRDSKTLTVTCQFYRWMLFQRNGVFYADGRANDLGKHSLATRDAEQARINLDKLDRQMAVDRGLAKPVAGTPSAAISICDGWRSYLEHCGRPGVMGGVSANSLKRYRAVRDKHLAYCDEHRLLLWTDDPKRIIEGYGAWLDHKGYAPRSLYLELTTIKSAVSWLIEEKFLPESCRVRLPLEKPQGTDTYCYTAEQVAAMIDHCRARPHLHWLTGVITALACTGVRIGELAGLRWTDIDLNSRIIRLTDERASRRKHELGSLRRLKSGRSRTIPIHDALYDVLTGIRRHADNRVFHGPRGASLKPDTVRVIFVREVIRQLDDRYPTPEGEIGFQAGTLHSFRHAFCSMAFLSGASERDIQDWLGHADSRMVAHYRHLRDADSVRRMRQISFFETVDRTGRSTG